MLKTLTLALSLASLSLLAAQAADAPAKGQQKAHTLKTEIVKQVEMDYLLFLPKDYSAKGSKKWPLILFLHGAGERGTNVNVVKVHGPPKIAEETGDLPFVILSPQCPPRQSWDSDVLIALVERVIKEHNIDTTRIYLTGLSMGGYGSWDLATQYPDRWAAVAPICGGGQNIRVLLAEKNKREALKKLPIWAFHGAKDEAVKLVESQRMVDAFKSLGNDAKLTIYPDAGHDSWTTSYANPELYTWFMKHTSSGDAWKRSRK